MFRIGVIGFIVRPEVRGGLNDSQRRVGGGKGRYIYRTIRWLMIVGMSG